MTFDSKRTLQMYLFTPHILQIEAVVDSVSFAVRQGECTALLGPSFLISNFTANIARPGAKSMKIHG